MSEKLYEKPGPMDEFIQIYPGLSPQERNKLMREQKFPSIQQRLEEINELVAQNNDNSRNKAQIFMEELLHDLKDV